MFVILCMYLTCNIPVQVIHLKLGTVTFVHIISFKNSQVFIFEHVGKVDKMKPF